MGDTGGFQGLSTPVPWGLGNGTDTGIEGVGDTRESLGLSPQVHWELGNGTDTGIEVTLGESLGTRGWDDAGIEGVCGGHCQDPWDCPLQFPGDKDPPGLSLKSSVDKEQSTWEREIDGSTGQECVRLAGQLRALHKLGSHHPRNGYAQRTGWFQCTISVPSIGCLVQEIHEWCGSK